MLYKISKCIFLVMLLGALYLSVSETDINLSNHWMMWAIVLLLAQPILIGQKK